MATQLVPNGVEVVFNAVQNGVPIVNVYHVHVPGAITTTTLAAINGIFKTWWDTSVAPMQNPSYVLNNITSTGLASGSGPQHVTSYTTSNQGTNSGGEAAANAAAVISWRTAQIGRSYRGRTYLGALSEGEIDSAQTIASATVTAMASAAQGLIDALTAAGMFLAVLSRVAGGVQRVTGLLVEIIGYVTDNKVDSQRRRTAN